MRRAAPLIVASQILTSSVFARPFTFDEYRGTEHTKSSLKIEGEEYTEIDGEGLSKFVNLQELRIYNTKIEELPDELCDISTLKSISITLTGLKQLPERIGSLVNLEDIYIPGAKLNSLPNSFASLQCLENLDLAHSDFQVFPKVIGELHGLKSLDMAQNKLTEIPDAAFKNLVHLKRLHLATNSFTKIPPAIAHLTSLVHLFLYYNKITEIPSEIGKLTNLEMLSLDHNEITTIHPEIKNLKKLGYLNLEINKLMFLPREIGDLAELSELDLNHNSLIKLPDEIGNMKKLERLRLSENRLTVLPLSFLNLKDSIKLLDLEKNPLQSRSVLGSLGINELVRAFGQKLRYTEPPTEVSAMQANSESEGPKKLSWNLKMLKTLINNPVPSRRMGETEFFEKWDKSIAVHISASEKEIFKAYVENLYRPSNDYKKRAMDEGLISLTLDLIHAVTEEFCKLLADPEKNQKDSIQVIQTNVSAICDGINNYCADKQLTELRIAYCILKGEMKNDEIELIDFVKTFIAAEKEEVFNMIVASSRIDRNIHVLNLWKNRLSDVLGFDFKFHTEFNAVLRDPFHGDKESVLAAFFRVFTPKRIIKSLTEEINKNKPVFCQALKLLYDNESLSEKQKKEMAVAKDFENFDVSKIKKGFVRYYLIRENILFGRIKPPRTFLQKAKRFFSRKK